MVHVNKNKDSCIHTTHSSVQEFLHKISVFSFSVIRANNLDFLISRSYFSGYLIGIYVCKYLMQSKVTGDDISKYLKLKMKICIFIFVEK